MNGKLDTNCVGVPKEGFSFSNKAKALLSAPSFSASSFQYDGWNIDMTMTKLLSTYRMAIETLIIY
jgi:uncharacterized protein (DUF2141 family)